MSFVSVLVGGEAKSVAEDVEEDDPGVCSRGVVEAGLAVVVAATKDAVELECRWGRGEEEDGLELFGLGKDAKK